MKLTLESTPRIVELEGHGASVKARLWQGETASGVPVVAYVTFVMPTIPPDDPRQADFVAALEQHAPPTPVVRAIDARFIL
jgi:hypothetical protein